MKLFIHFQTSTVEVWEWIIDFINKKSTNQISRWLKNIVYTGEILNKDTDTTSTGTIDNVYI